MTEKIKIPADVFSTADALQFAGDARTLKSLVQKKRLRSLGRGYFASPDIDAWTALVLVVAKYFPSAVISGKSALKLHGYYPFQLPEVEADIPKTTNQRNSLLTFHRKSATKLIGVSELRVLTKVVKVYDPERALADLFLAKEKKTVLHAVLKSYLDSNRVRHERLHAYDQEFKIEMAKTVDNLRVAEQYVQVGENLPKEKPVLENILECAIHLYSQKGEQGLDALAVAKEAGVPPSVVRAYFPNRNAIVRGVMRAYEDKHLSAGGGDQVFLSKTPPREYLLQCADAALAATDSDELAYRIQKWAIAEGCGEVLGIVERICSAFIATVKEKIMQEVPRISETEAETRAIMFVSIVDQYTHMRWFYANLLKTKTAKHEWLENYRQMIRRDVMKMMFAPASLS